MIHVKEYKEPQHNLKSEKFFTPKKLYLPLSQHTGKPSLVCIKPGEIVEEGQKIAKEAGFISASLHAPTKGKILNIDIWHHPNLKKQECIIMQCEDEQKNYTPRKDIASLSKKEILEIIKDSGIVGMGGAAFPTQVKLNPPKPIDTLIINGCECEPYLAADYRLMVENLSQVFNGVEIICKLIEPKQVIFAVEQNKPDAIKGINRYINTKKVKLPNPKLIILKSTYPQGGEKQLIHSTSRRKVPPGKLPFDVGCLVHNVGTCFAIYDAIYLTKPLIERLVSFCGDALKEPKNIWVKIGTPLQALFDEKILQFKDEPKKIICGGPMMGLALDNLEYPILKGTGGFLFLKDLVEEIIETPCLRCARCVDACPMNLLPLEYVKRVKKEEYKALLDFNIGACMDCGCCTYECPAKIPIGHYIKVGKDYVPNGK